MGVLFTRRCQIKFCLNNQTIRNLRKVKKSSDYIKLTEVECFLFPSLRGKKEDIFLKPREKAPGELFVAMGVSAIEETCLSLHH